MNDTTVEQGRRRESRAVRSVVAGVVFQATYVIAQFVILAVLFRSVGPEQLGLWVTVFGITAWLNLLLLGMDRATLTWLGRSAHAQPATAWRIVHAIWLVVGISSTTAVAAIVLLGGWVPWAKVLNADSEAAIRLAAPTALAALVMMAASLLPAMGGLILQALQRGGQRHLLGVVGQVIGVALLLAATAMGWPLPVLGVIIVSPIMLAGLLQWIGVWRAMPPRRTVQHLHAEKIVGPILATGLAMWVIELVQVLMINSGPLLVAQWGGAEAVVPYGAVYRLIGPLVVCYMVVSHAYWPALSDALAARDEQWIVRALRRSLLASCGLWLTGAVGCLLLGQWFIAWWLGPMAVPTVGLLAAGLLFALVHGVYYWSLTALSGLNFVRVQVASSVAGMMLYILVGMLLLGSWTPAHVFLLQSAGIGLVAAVNVFLLRARLRRRLNVVAQDRG
ncbi:MAG: hypothetical protein IT445_09270 [Phycisphaeraceae bacterium]|nr:hypothetical protein [Phycisphaeraceae bacterium]